MPVFRRDGIAFDYADEGHGAPFIVQHGLAADTQQPVGLIGSVPRRRVIALTCRGHGSTHPLGSPDRLSIPDFADDVVALARHLGTGRATFGGISMGAAVALSIAARFPRLVDGLLLVRPAWLDRPEPANLAVFPILAQYLRQWGQDGGAGFVHEPEYRRIAALSSDNAGSLRRQFEASRPAERATVLERIFRSPLGYAGDDLRLVSAPTLIIGNGEDAMHPIGIARDLTRWMPQATCREVTSKSVDPLRHGAEVRRLALGFLAGPEAASRQDQ